MTDQNPATVVLTGATSGIGAAAAQLLAGSARRLIVHGPEPASAVRPLLDRLRSAGQAEVVYVPADFDRLDDVVALADHVTGTTDQVDVLINNAGRPGAPQRRCSSDGYEATLQTNYLAAVLLTERLLPLVPGTGRVVHVASATHLSTTFDLDDPQLRRRYEPTTAYARSKLALVAHAVREAAHIRPGIVSVHPGVVATSLLHAMFAVRGEPASRGGENVVAAALRADVPSGAYLDERQVAEPAGQVRDATFREDLHRLTTKLLGPWLHRAS
ncbi:SDR family NAD(P)-dependent oxidoreductase [Micromonospora avicenniae]|uniref:NAD(P)-dependent dehydrogenase, short-chain alcohol dehydrogenase family n=1 Tax=Micromonospora avicenniae TaxID=1198245 RepID=A0A1N6VMM9_9ACTN|nr:SDR family NAD(P)-dependent oxidoreductase [Micromonospora avicenniae]SIQ78998.1 NAD(P)-dependent dehydrogenase, short-chain alcohol dehydrogenase family [Micromonospora avicenniae]